MDLLVFHMSNVNWWSVLLATMASFAVGGIWYAQPMFGKAWMKAIGHKPKDVNNSAMAKLFAVTAVLAFVTSVGLATLMEALVFKTWQQGAILGAAIWLAFCATNRGIHMLFEQKGGMGLYLINAGHDLVFLVVAGAIIGLL